MSKRLNWWSRTLHRWGALACALPLLVVIASGLLLQVKKQVPWVQPPTARGERENVDPAQTWSDILAVARSVPEAEVSGWSDIDRLDVRPERGLVKVQCRNRWELQIDLESGALLSSTKRRSDLIESLHDGSFFGEPVKLGVFLTSGVLLLVLWFTGVWLWYLPIRNRRINRQRVASTNATR
ncbi:MAG: PepSY domain-containing protein [Phycisphaerales bacterium]